MAQEQLRGRLYEPAQRKSEWITWQATRTNAQSAQCTVVAAKLGAFCMSRVGHFACRVLAQRLFSHGLGPPHISRAQKPFAAGAVALL